MDLLSTILKPMVDSASDILGAGKSMAIGLIDCIFKVDSNSLRDGLFYGGTVQVMVEICRV